MLSNSSCLIYPPVYYCSGAYSLCRTRQRDSSPVLRQLHWLPVRQRVQFKLALLVYKVLHDATAAYLVDDCQLVHRRQSVENFDGVRLRSSVPFSFPLLPLLLFLSLISPSLRSIPSSLPHLPLEVRLQVHWGSGEHCKFPYRGLGRSSSRNRIWCILALIRHGGSNLKKLPEDQLTKFT